MVSKNIKLDKKSEKALNQLLDLDREKLFALLDRFFEREAQIMAGQIVKTKLSGNPVKRRTGTLARSLIGQAERLNGIPSFRVGVLRGPALGYASALEEGATIRPKNAKALAIPQKPALTPAGVDRFGGPRNYRGSLRFLPFRRGVAVGKLVDENDASLYENPYDAQAVYLLVKKVVIKGRHYLRDGVDEQFPAFMKRMTEFLAGALLNVDAT